MYTLESENNIHIRVRMFGSSIMNGCKQRRQEPTKRIQRRGRGRGRERVTERDTKLIMKVNVVNTEVATCIETSSLPLLILLFMRGVAKKNDG